MFNRKFTVHCLNLDVIESMTENMSQTTERFGPIEAAREYTKQNLPGFECIPCNRFEAPGLWRNEAVHHGDNLSVVLWVREVGI
jgi:hypothetical protein